MLTDFPRLTLNGVDVGPSRDRLGRWLSVAFTEMVEDRQWTRSWQDDTAPRTAKPVRFYRELRGWPTKPFGFSRVSA